MKHMTSRVTICLAAFSLCACASASRTNSAPQAPGKQIITADEISKSGLNNVWDLLRNRAVGYDFSEDRYGRPRAIRTRRGRTSLSIKDSDSPLVIIDGARVTDVSALRDLSTDAIDSVELMNGIAGTANQGTNASAGVIYIHTREASLPRG
jgi:outer membrane receptor for ferrienterochelin and colicin